MNVINLLATFISSSITLYFLQVIFVFCVFSIGLYETKIDFFKDFIPGRPLVKIFKKRMLEIEEKEKQK